MRTSCIRLTNIWTYVALTLAVIARGAVAAEPPVLVIGTTANPFTGYYAEILRAEGLNSFQSLDLSAVSAGTLANYRLVLLGHTALTASHVSMFTTWVNGGGKLVAMRPDVQLGSLLGLAGTGTTLPEGYVLVNTSTSPGSGIVNQTMQFHGTADRYNLSGATSVAMLYTTSTSATSNPAVSLRTVGTSGGEAAAFTYDLARSVLQTRQGNPAWSGQDRDGLSPTRSNDLYFGAASFDNKPDWVDPSKVAIPQADEQQRLLANLITYMLRDRLPLPRFWYLPFFKKAAVVMTGDDHANGGTAGRFNSHIAASTTGCNVDNWECIRSTSYIYPNSPLTNTQAAQYTSQGFEVAVHVSSNCADWTPSSLQGFYASDIAAWRNRYPSLSGPQTNRTHCIVWSDYDTQPQVALNNGIRLDTNYYYWPGSWLGTIPGYFTGSAIPMKFARTDGTTINVYQATTQMTDESSQTYPSFAEALLDAALGSTGYYGVFTTNIHTDSSTGPVQTMSDQIVAAAKARGVPVVSAIQMLRWLDARDSSVFSDLNWSGTALTFTATPGANATGIRGMVPASFGGGGLTGLSRNAAAVSYTVEIIKGIAYAIFPATAGTYEATYGASSVSVSVSPASVTLGPSQTQQFTALVTGTGNTAVTWTINPATGTISSTGLYTAPSAPSNEQVLVTAYSVADPSKWASATVQLTGPPTPPVISAVTTSGAAGTATIEWTTNENSTSVVDYGTAPGQLTQSATVSGMVTAHTVTLTGLTSGGRYYYRVTSADADPASAMWPPADKPAATVYAAGHDSIWTRTATPAVSDSGDGGSVELGMKFRASVSGNVTGLRFYKASANTGTHIATLWTSGGGVLARITIAAETPSGWQEAMFDAPVAITANTTYTVSYLAPAGHYSVTPAGFTNAITSGALRALASGEDGGNGVYAYSATPVFPAQTYQANNYWVDVLFIAGTDTIPPVVSGVTATPAATTATIAWTTNEASDSTVLYGTVQNNLGLTATGNANTTSHTVNLTGLTTGTTYYYRVQSKDAANNTATLPDPPASPASFNTTSVDTTPPTITAIAVTPASDRATVTWTTNEAADTRVNYGTTAALGQSASDPALTTSHTITILGLTSGTTYHYRVSSTDAGGNGALSPASSTLTFTTTSSMSLWTNQTTPAVASANDTAGVELGLKFRSDTNGYVSGVRFYKGATNTGAHIGNLWSSTGAPLATVTFINETATGWQEALFSSPVSITANTTYVVSYYAPAGGYAYNLDYFTSTAFTNGPLTAPASPAVSGNGVFRYGPSSGFPDASWSGTNYWVDVAFTTEAADTNPPVISGVTATPAATTATIAWTTNEASDSTVLYGTVQNNLSLAATGNANATSHTVSLTGLTTGTTYYYRVQSKDAANNTATSPVTSANPASFNTVAVDTTPPLITAVAATPSSDRATITWTTNEAADTRVNYGTTAALGQSASDPALTTSHSITVLGLTQGTTYHYRVSSTDAAGNGALSPASSTLTFTTGTNAVTTKVFSDTAVPAVIDNNIFFALELGMKFRSDVAGTVTAIRFYKGPNNTGVHSGSLWSRTGTLLGSVTFTNETASGWQQANLPTPVAIAAGTTYVVSYQSPNGQYSTTSNFFATSGLYNGPLYALRSGVDGNNGVYRLGASAFPNQSSNSSNYWVDAVVSTPSGPLTRFPNSTTIETGGGTLRAGSATQLAADDNAYYELNSTTSGTRTVSWYATFNGVPNSLTSLKVAYVGKNSRSCTETTSVWNWTTGAWLQLNSAAVTTNEVLRSNLIPSGVLGNYVSGTSGTGDVRVRVRCTTTANFNSSADLISITYAP